jgi:hypothetical protein
MLPVMDALIQLSGQQNATRVAVTLAVGVSTALASVDEPLSHEGAEPVQAQVNQELTQDTPTRTASCAT